MIDINRVIDIATEAGKSIFQIYNSEDFNIKIKSDESPLTRADVLSHKIITERLLSLCPEIPILSEEGKDIPYEIRKNWNRFWLVDPLDGTKEFIKKNDEFTVNIALIENNIPTMGIIYAPALNKSDNNKASFPGTIYYADKESGSFKKNSGDKPVKLPRFEFDGIIKAVKSRSHSSEDEERFFKSNNVAETVAVGSSLKFCMIAEGAAQIYYRHGPTYEWDVAAGYAIAGFAGAQINGLKFNKENLLNGSFIVKRAF